MGRKRTKNLDLPPRMFVSHGAYYHVVQNTWTRLSTSKAEALIMWAEIEGVESTQHQATLQMAWERYRKEVVPRKAPRTRKDNEAESKKLLEVFGHLPLDAIKPKHVARFMMARTDASGRHAHVRATREKALLSHIFNMARIWGYTDKPNPCAGIRGKTSRRDRYITDEELKKILSKSRPSLADTVELAYLIGQRPADVRKVLRSDVQNGEIRITQDKTGATLRIEITERLQAVINRCIERANSFRVSSLYLVLDEKGQPYNEWTLRKHWREACKAAGVPNAQFRDLRAKAGSDSEDTEAAKDLLGHENMRTTEGYIRNRRGKLVKALR